MLLEFTRPFIQEAETVAAGGDVNAVLASLRKLSLDDFGLLLLSMPNPDYPNLSKVLPRMASDEVQQNWTGACGQPLLQQSLDFVRSVRTEFTGAKGKPLEDAKILDYGCGYGRLLRLMMRFASVDNLVGCDPWDESIRISGKRLMGTSPMGIRPCHLAIWPELHRAGASPAMTGPCMMTIRYWFI